MDRNTVGAVQVNCGILSHRYYLASVRVMEKSVIGCCQPCLTNLTFRFIITSNLRCWSCTLYEVDRINPHYRTIRVYFLKSPWFRNTELLVSFTFLQALYAQFHLFGPRQINVASELNSAQIPVTEMFVKLSQVLITLSHIIGPALVIHFCKGACLNYGSSCGILILTKIVFKST